nr:nucleolar transcription factor 1-B-like [Procambarus clarkii]XP_045604338.1 nucleolar transcription factor 1-B-like [Procambarus clarkii]
MAKEEGGNVKIENNDSQGKLQENKGAGKKKGNKGKAGKIVNKGGGGLTAGNDALNTSKNLTQNVKAGLKNKKQKKAAKTRKAKEEPRKRKRPVDWGTEEMKLSDGLRAEHEGRACNRDLRTLYVRFPKSLKISKGTEVMDLVKEAIDVRLPRGSSVNFCTHCFLEFKSEEEADRMKGEIAKMKVKDEPFFVDYVGKKSTYCSARQPGPVNPLKLYIGSVPMDTTRDDLKNVFHTSERIDYSKKQKNVRTRFAFITYKTKEEALRVFESSKDLKINGKEVTVMFARAKNTNITDKTKVEESPTKKMKTGKKDVEEKKEDKEVEEKEEEEDEEDEEEEDEDEEEEGDDEEEEDDDDEDEEEDDDEEEMDADSEEDEENGNE